MSKMGSHCSFGHLKHKLWANEGSGVEFPGVCQFWLPTTNSQESTQNIGRQTTCNIPLESSRRELQLCLRPRRDPRFARKVMRLQSHGSPGWRSFGTPTRESRGSPAGVPGVPGQKGHFDVGPVERCRVYYRGVRWWLTLEVRAVVSLVSKCSWLVPNTQGCPGMWTNHFVVCFGCKFKLDLLVPLPSLIPGLLACPFTPF
jgi:hypothetical protein